MCLDENKSKINDKICIQLLNAYISIISSHVDSKQNLINDLNLINLICNIVIAIKSIKIDDNNTKYELLEMSDKTLTLILRLFNKNANLISSKYLNINGILTSIYVSVSTVYVI